MGLDVSGYGVVRSLTRQGVPVVGLWRRSDECGRFSRYCTAVRVLPDDDAAWIDTITSLAARYDRPVLFPSNDRYADLLARYRDTLAPRTRFHWVAADDIEAVIDKSRIGEVAERIGLAVPRTHRPVWADVRADAHEFVYPCLVKPITRFRAGLPADAKTITCSSEDDLVALYQQTPDLLGRTVWQEIVEGEDDAIYQGTVLCPRPGEVAAIACVRKIRQFVPGFGITSFGRTEWQPDVVEQTTRLVEALQWTGIGSVEFKRSARDGQFYFIEMNPRVPWYNVLFADAGINLPFLSWCTLTGDSVPAVRQTDGLAWISLASDVASFWHRHGCRSLSTRAWLGSLGNARSFSWFDAADPLPALATAVRQSALAWRLVMPDAERAGMRKWVTATAGRG
jgi:predicted ATP-grasp superfamily ATP-dependent carboligase